VFEELEEFECLKGLRERSVFRVQCSALWEEKFEGFESLKERSMFNVPRSALLGQKFEGFEGFESLKSLRECSG